MFSENLKKFRKQKGLTQEELAERLHVVRQTISKWEKGLSVPDSNLLIQVAAVFETSVGTLLGDTVELPDDKNIIAEKLEQLNVLLAERNRRSRRLWKTVAIALFSIVVVIVLSMTLFLAVRIEFSEDSFDAPPVSIEKNVQIKEAIKNQVTLP
jgi:putative transcriptional regulator